MKNMKKEPSNNDLLRESIVVGDDSMMRYAMDSGALPNGLGNGGFIPLAESVKRGLAYFVKELLACGASASVRDAGGNTALHYAVIGGHADIFDVLCEAYPEALSMKNKRGETPADLVFSLPRAELANRSSFKALVGKSLKLNENIQKILLDHNDFRLLDQFSDFIDPGFEFSSMRGLSALSYCASHDLEQSLLFLMEKDAPIRQRSGAYNEVALFYACRSKSGKSIKFLVEKSYGTIDNSSILKAFDSALASNCITGIDQLAYHRWKRGKKDFFERAVQKNPIRFYPALNSLYENTLLNVAKNEKDKKGGKNSI